MGSEDLGHRDSTELWAGVEVRDGGVGVQGRPREDLGEGDAPVGRDLGEDLWDIKVSMSPRLSEI